MAESHNSSTETPKVTDGASSGEQPPSCATSPVADIAAKNSQDHNETRSSSTETSKAKKGTNKSGFGYYCCLGKHTYVETVEEDGKGYVKLEGFESRKVDDLYAIDRHGNLLVWKLVGEIEQLLRELYLGGT